MYAVTYARTVLFLRIPGYQQGAIILSKRWSGGASQVWHAWILGSTMYTPCYNNHKEVKKQLFHSSSSSNSTYVMYREQIHFVSFPECSSEMSNVNCPDSKLLFLTQNILDPESFRCELSEYSLLSPWPPEVFAVQELAWRKPGYPPTFVLNWSQSPCLRLDL